MFLSTRRKAHGYRAWYASENGCFGHTVSPDPIERPKGQQDFPVGDSAPCLKYYFVEFPYHPLSEYRLIGRLRQPGRADKGDTLRLTLKAIICLETTIEATDEPFLKIEIDNRPEPEYWGPFSMRQGDAEAIDRSFDFDSHVTVWLYESDSSALDSRRNDFIGVFSVSADHPRGAFTRSLEHLRGDGIVGASTRDPVYSISYEVTRDADDRLDQWNLELVSLRCHDAQEGTDEVYITVDDRRIWGSPSMRTGETDTIQESLPVSSPVKIELWEEDPYNSECLGSFSITIAEGFDFSRLYEHTFARNRGIVGDARYTLSYRLNEIE